MLAFGWWVTFGFLTIDKNTLKCISNLHHHSFSNRVPGFQVGETENTVAPTQPVTDYFFIKIGMMGVITLEQHEIIVSNHKYLLV